MWLWNCSSAMVVYPALLNYTPVGSDGKWNGRFSRTSTPALFVLVRVSFTSLIHTIHIECYSLPVCWILIFQAYCLDECEGYVMEENDGRIQGVERSDVTRLQRSFASPLSSFVWRFSFLFGSLWLSLDRDWRAWGETKRLQGSH